MYQTNPTKSGKAGLGLVSRASFFLRWRVRNFFSVHSQPFFGSLFLQGRYACDWETFTAVREDVPKRMPADLRDGNAEKRGVRLP